MTTIYSAVKAIIFKEDEFLIVKQKIGDITLWDLPGGRINFGENPFDALIREVKEETNLQIKITKPAGLWWFFWSDQKTQVICNTFICSLLGGDIDLTKNTDPNETLTEFKWVSKRDFLMNYTVGHESLKTLISEL